MYFWTHTDVHEFEVAINRDYCMVGECVRFLCTSCERLYKRANHAVICLCRTCRDYFKSENLSKANNVETKYWTLKTESYHLFLCYLAWIVSQSCFSLRFMFFIGETLLLLDIKAKCPFAPSPTRRLCCEQNHNTIFFTSEKNRIANQNADTMNFH